MINIGLLGLGTVGSGVLEILNSNKEKIKKLTGEDINISKILVKNLNKKRDIALNTNILTNNYKDIIDNKEIDIIIEVTTDLEEGYNYIKQALENKKHVVTASKAVVSKYYEELVELANKNQVAFLYEASVAGGIPVIKPLKEQKYLNEINKVQGILNGTCNYILTRMIDEKKDYLEVLKDAQDLGYAELDPTADVKGHDTLRKLRILSTLCLDIKILEEDIYLEGIEKIKKIDIDCIKSMNKTVKLIAEAKKIDKGYIATVMPTLVKKDNYFANVNYAYNSVSMDGNNVGCLKFFGQGAGKLPTANAVLSDLIDIITSTFRKDVFLDNKEYKNKNRDYLSSYYLRISDVSSKEVEKINKIKKEVLSEKSDIIIITKEIKIEEIEKIVKNKDYFIAKILD